MQAFSWACWCLGLAAQGPTLYREYSPKALDTAGHGRYGVLRTEVLLLSVSVGDNGTSSILEAQTPGRIYKVDPLIRNPNY